MFIQATTFHTLSLINIYKQYAKNIKNLYSSRFNSSGVELKLGVISVDWESIIDEAKMVGAGYRFNVLKPVERAVAAGFKHIELELDTFYVIPNSFTAEVRRKLLQLKDEEGVSFTAHLPIWSTDLSWLNEHIRRASISTIVESIKMTEFLEPMYYVIHATGDQASKIYRELKGEKDVEFLLLPLLKRAEESLEEIISKTEINPRRLACETVEFPLSLTLELVEECDTSFLIDTGHVLSGQMETTDVFEVMEKVRDRLVGFHLHDGYYRVINGEIVRKDHLPLGGGNLPVKKFFQQLLDCNFSGPIVFELSLREAIESLEYLKKSLNFEILI